MNTPHFTQNISKKIKGELPNLFCVTSTSFQTITKEG
jgi:hypothetical protein